jgi:hypothetical protein
MSPYHIIDLTEIVQEHSGRFLVYKSRDSAEHSPDYEMIAEFATPKEAEDFLRNGDEEAPSKPGPIGFVD